jgi:hypothetical protein
MSDKPYDEYADKVVSDLRLYSNFEYSYVGDSMASVELRINLLDRELRSLLADAWLSGLAYSLNLIEGKKEKRYPWEVRLRDAPKTFTGGKMAEPLHYEADDVQPI